MRCNVQQQEENAVFEKISFLQYHIEQCVCSPILKLYARTDLNYDTTEK